MAQDVSARRSKRWKWLVGSLAFLLVAGAVGVYVVKRDLSSEDSKIKPALKEQLKEMIAEASDSLYRVSYKNFDINIDSGYGVVEDFKLYPDSTVLRKLITERKAPNNVLQLQTKRLVLTDFALGKAGSGRKFTVQNITIESPAITITNKNRQYNDTTGTEKSRKLISFMSDLFKLAAIENIAVKNLDFAMINDNGERRRKTGLYNLNLQIAGFTTREIKSEEKSTGTVLHIKKYRLETADNLYFLTLDDLLIQPHTSSASIAEVTLTPRLGKSEFYQTAKYAKDRYHFVYRDLVMNGIETGRLLKKQQLHIRSVNVGNAWAEIYTDYQWPRRTPPKRDFGSPHELLLRLAFDITVDRLTLKHADTYYRVKARDSEKVATLSVLNSHGYITNITNNNAAIQRNPFMHVNLRSRLMNAGEMQMMMTFNLRNSTYSYSSKMGQMPMTALNPFSEAMSLLSVQTGTIDRVDLQVDASNRIAKGNVDLLYSDMKVKVLKKDNDENQLKKRRFLSFVSNATLPNDNPRKNGKLRKGPIYVEREPTMSFFGFMAEAVVDGISSSMTGIGQEKDRPDGNIVTEIGKAIAGPKKKNRKKE